MAWGLGLKIPPPHFMGFIPVALFTGSLFGTLWSVAMWVLWWRYLGWGWLFTASAGVAGGVLFGSCLAAYYRHSAVKNELPSWERYPGT